MKKRNNEPLGVVLVGFTMIYWGFTTVMMKHALLYMSSSTYMMLRFLIAAVLVLGVYGKRLWKKRNRQLLLHGFVLGFLQLVFMSCSTMSLKYTTSSNSVFIAQLSFIFVPLLQCIGKKTLPDGKLVLTVLVLLTGLGIFANVWEMGVNIGSFFSLMTALFNAINILCVKKFCEVDDSELLGVLQIVFCALLSVPMWLMDPGPVQWCSEAVSLLFYTSVIGSAVAFVAYTAGQARMEPVSVSFMGLLQPVFAMIGGAVIADEFGRLEAVTPNMVLGAVIILTTLLLYLSNSGNKKQNREGDHHEKRISV